MLLRFCLIHIYNHHYTESHFLFNKKKKSTLWPIFMDGVQLPHSFRVTSRRQFTFCHQVLRKSWYSFDWSLKDEGLSRPWSHPVVLNTGPLNWESIMPLVYLSLCLGLGLFMLFLCDLFFICSLTVIAINHYNVINTGTLFLYIIFYYFWMIRWMKKANNFQIAKVQPQGVA